MIECLYGKKFIDVRTYLETQLWIQSYSITNNGGKLQWKHKKTLQFSNEKPQKLLNSKSNIKLPTAPTRPFVYIAAEGSWAKSSFENGDENYFEEFPLEIFDVVSNSNHSDCRNISTHNDDHIKNDQYVKLIDTRQATEVITSIELSQDKKKKSNNSNTAFVSTSAGSYPLSTSRNKDTSSIISLSSPSIKSSTSSTTNGSNITTSTESNITVLNPEYLKQEDYKVKQLSKLGATYSKNRQPLNPNASPVLYKRQSPMTRHHDQMKYTPNTMTTASNSHSNTITTNTIDTIASDSQDLTVQDIDNMHIHVHQYQIRDPGRVDTFDSIDSYDYHHHSIDTSTTTITTSTTTDMITSTSIIHTTTTNEDEYTTTTTNTDVDNGDHTTVSTATNIMMSHPVNYMRRMSLTSLHSYTTETNMNSNSDLTTNHITTSAGSEENCHTTTTTDITTADIITDTTIIIHDDIRVSKGNFYNCDLANTANGNTIETHHHVPKSEVDVIKKSDTWYSDDDEDEDELWEQEIRIDEKNEVKNVYDSNIDDVMLEDVCRKINDLLTLLNERVYIESYSIQKSSSVWRDKTTNTSSTTRPNDYEQLTTGKRNVPLPVEPYICKSTTKIVSLPTFENGDGNYFEEFSCDNNNYNNSNIINDHDDSIAILNELRRQSIRLDHILDGPLSPAVKRSSNNTIKPKMQDMSQSSTVDSRLESIHNDIKIKHHSKLGSTFYNATLTNKDITTTSTTTTTGGGGGGGTSASAILAAKSNKSQNYMKNAANSQNYMIAKKIATVTSASATTSTNTNTSNNHNNNVQDNDEDNDEDNKSYYSTSTAGEKKQRELNTTMIDIESEKDDVLHNTQFDWLNDLSITTDTHNNNDGDGGIMTMKAPPPHRPPNHHPQHQSYALTGHEMKSTNVYRHHTYNKYQAENAMYASASSSASFLSPAFSDISLSPNMQMDALSPDYANNSDNNIHESSANTVTRQKGKVTFDMLQFKEILETHPLSSSSPLYRQRKGTSWSFGDESDCSSVADSTVYEDALNDDDDNENDKGDKINDTTIEKESKILIKKVNHEDVMSALGGSTSGVHHSNTVSKNDTGTRIHQQQACPDTHIESNTSTSYDFDDNVSALTTPHSYVPKHVTNNTYQNTSNVQAFSPMAKHHSYGIPYDVTHTTTTTTTTTTNSNTHQKQQHDDTQSVISQQHSTTSTLITSMVQKTEYEWDMTPTPLKDEDYDMELVNPVHKSDTTVYTDNMLLANTKNTKSTSQRDIYSSSGSSGSHHHSVSSNSRKNIFSTSTTAASSKKHPLVSSTSASASASEPSSSQQDTSHPNAILVQFMNPLTSKRLS